MAYLVTAVLAIAFFLLQKDRLREPELVVPALIGFPILFMGIRTFLRYMFPPKPSPIDNVVDRALESDDPEKPKGELPEASYKNWKDDLGKVVENHMTLDEFLDRWRGRGPDRNMKELEEIKKAEVKGPVNPLEPKNRVREILEEARRKLGEARF